MITSASQWTCWHLIPTSWPWIRCVRPVWQMRLHGVGWAFIQQMRWERNFKLEWVEVCHCVRFLEYSYSVLISCVKHICIYIDSQESIKELSLHCKTVEGRSIAVQWNHLSGGVNDINPLKTHWGGKAELWSHWISTLTAEMLSVDWEACCEPLLLDM